MTKSTPLSRPQMAASVNWTMPQIAKYLTDGFWQDQNFVRHSYNVAPGGVLSCDLSDLTGAEAKVARMALDAWTRVTGIRFDTTSTAGERAQIRFTNDDPRGAYSQATDGFGNTVTNSVINIPANWAEGPSGGWNSYYYQSYLHEIGHALGLGHAGNYNGSATYGVSNSYLNDSWQASVMSYFDQDENTSINASRAYVMTPMMADIVAVQSLYGTAKVQTGATVWGVGATLTGAMAMASNLMVSGADITMTIVDSSGTDMLDLSNDKAAQRIRLEAGQISDCYGLKGNLSIAVGTMIENLRCGSGSDRATGNAANNAIDGGAGKDWLEGGRGNDTLSGGADADRLDGGAGADVLRGGTGSDLYIVDLGDTVFETSNAGTDRVVASCDFRLSDHVENLDLTGAARLGNGNALANVMNGTDGANKLAGGAGNDTLNGYGGNDELTGGSGADRLTGGRGDDIYIVDSADTVIEQAGEGYDTIRSDAALVLGANIEAGVLTGTASVSLTGNALSNSLTGNSGANRLIGGGGSDLMHGGGGADAFVFVAGASGAIDDFQDNIDQIEIARQDGVRTISDVLAGAIETAGRVMLHFAEEVIRVEHATLDQLRDDILIIA